MTALPFPNIDPVAIHIGDVFAIRWYAIAYVAGILIGIFYMKRLAVLKPCRVPPDYLDDFMVWAIFGIILGGRIGYVAVYQDHTSWQEAIAIWKGGMSFHGGCIGVIVAAFLFARRKLIALFPLLDLLACAAPIGLFLGRIANFINGELFGRVTDVPWAVMFPRGGFLPRHPSQLYEAALEGLALFILLAVLVRVEWVRKKAGLLSGVFMIGYGLARSTVELFREPDANMGFLYYGVTTGQALSIPMIIIGSVIVIWAARRQYEP